MSYNSCIDMTTQQGFQECEMMAERQHLVVVMFLIIIILQGSPNISLL